MLNLYHTIKDNDGFKKLVVDDLVFVEYTCMQDESKFGLWSDTNYFAFIFSGKKMWRSIYHSYVVEDGDVLFVKKGANLTHQFFDDQFCAIFVFIPDDFIKSFLQKNPNFLSANQKDLSDQDAIIRLTSNKMLHNYATSISGYLTLANLPDEQLIKHKLEELLLSLFISPAYKNLTDYFVSLCQSEVYQLKRVVEENFAYNLNLDEYAQLCHMSLSAFKRLFKKTYHSTPAKWIKDRKLDLASHKLQTTDLQVAQIVFECGFETTAHFTRIFKEKFKLSPVAYRQKYQVNQIDK